MPIFRNSEEGVKVYQQLGLQYPTLANLIYEDFLKVTNSNIHARGFDVDIEETMTQ